MSRAAARVGVGTRFRYDGETAEVVEMAANTAGSEVVLKDGQGRLLRLPLKELPFSERAVIRVKVRERMERMTADAGS